MASIDIEVSCDCGNRLKAYASGTTITVEVCEDCKTNAYNNGHEAGADDERAKHE